MRAAGCTVPADGPVAKWTAAWVATGVCTRNGPTRLTQHILGPSPPIALVEGASLHRGAPRPDLAPPLVPAPAAIQAYLAFNAQTWCLVAVSGGDGTYDDAAHITFEVAQKLPGLAPAATEALIAAHQALRRLGPPVPTTLRCAPAVAALAGGLTPHASDYRAVRREWESTVALRPLTLSATTHQHAWMERASAIAAHCRPDRTWGQALPPAPAAPPTLDQCSICLDDFTDLFPTPAPHSCCPARFSCTHAVCRSCDWTLQRNAGPLAAQAGRCPLCRAPRTALTFDRPGGPP